LIDYSATVLISDVPPHQRGERKQKLHGYSKEGYGQKSKKDLIGKLFNF
jgi:hypothetical protein